VDADISGELEVRKGTHWIDMNFKDGAVRLVDAWNDICVNVTWEALMDSTQWTLGDAPLSVTRGWVKDMPKCKTLKLDVWSRFEAMTRIQCALMWMAKRVSADGKLQMSCDRHEVTMMQLKPTGVFATECIKKGGLILPAITAKIIQPTASDMDATFKKPRNSVQIDIQLEGLKICHFLVPPSISENSIREAASSKKDLPVVEPYWFVRRMQINGGACNCVLKWEVIDIESPFTSTGPFKVSEKTQKDWTVVQKGMRVSIPYLVNTTALDVGDELLCHA
jgi:hypothetical protein